MRAGCGDGAITLCFDTTRVGIIAGLGLAVGVLTGVVGVGAGFLIVPALVLLVGLPMKEAVGSSLAIVAANSAAGFAGYVGSIAIAPELMATFTSVAIGGSYIGSTVSRRLSPETLKKGFAIFLIVVAVYIVLRETEMR